MYEKLERCPVCGNSNIINYFICTDYTVSGESFALSICSHCNLIFTNPRPAKEIIGKYYNSYNYQPHTNRQTLTDRLYRFIRSINNRQKINLINRVADKGKLLDVGCGTGSFLKLCRQNGWDISGVEPTPSANQAASSSLGFQVTADLREIKEHGSFSVITFWHVLEHIYELNESIEFAKGLLSKNGKMIIALPNNKSYDAQKYHECWAAFDVPRHLYHFNQDSFSFLVREHGLKIQETVPMYFDAYYISLLSEQYKSGIKSWTKSFINGYKSNIYAKKNNKDYSSLIYVVR